MPIPQVFEQKREVERMLGHCLECQCHSNFPNSSHVKALCTQIVGEQYSSTSQQVMSNEVPVSVGSVKKLTEIGHCQRSDCAACNRICFGINRFKSTLGMK